MPANSGWDLIRGLKVNSIRGKMFGAYKLRMWVHGSPGILCKKRYTAVYS